MPETLTIPETLPFPGEKLIEALAQLDALASYLYNTMAGGTTTGPGDKALDVGWELFKLGFGADASEGPLDDLVEKRSGELYDEWIADLARTRGGDDGGDYYRLCDEARVLGIPVDLADPASPKTVQALREAVEAAR